VRVLLSKHQTATEPYADEYDWLMEQGITDRWDAMTPDWIEGEDQ